MQLWNQGTRELAFQTLCPHNNLSAFWRVICILVNVSNNNLSDAAPMM